MLGADVITNKITFPNNISAYTLALIPEPPLDASVLERFDTFIDTDKKFAEMLYYTHNGQLDKLKTVYSNQGMIAREFYKKIATPPLILSTSDSESILVSELAVIQNHLHILKWLLNFNPAELSLLSKRRYLYDNITFLHVMKNPLYFSLAKWLVMHQILSPQVETLERNHMPQHHLREVYARPRSPEEKIGWNYYVWLYHAAKKNYDYLLKEYPDHFEKKEHPEYKNVDGTTYTLMSLLTRANHQKSFRMIELKSNDNKPKYTIDVIYHHLTKPCKVAYMFKSGDCRNIADYANIGEYIMRELNQQPALIAEYLDLIIDLFSQAGQFVEQEAIKKLAMSFKTLNEIDSVQPKKLSLKYQELFFDRLSCARNEEKMSLRSVYQLLDQLGAPSAILSFPSNLKNDPENICFHDALKPFLAHFVEDEKQLDRPYRLTVVYYLLLGKVTRDGSFPHFLIHYPHLKTEPTATSEEAFAESIQRNVLQIGQAEAILQFFILLAAFQKYSILDISSASLGIIPHHNNDMFYQKKPYHDKLVELLQIEWKKGRNAQKRVIATIFHIMTLPQAFDLVKKSVKSMSDEVFQFLLTYRHSDEIYKKALFDLATQRGPWHHYFSLAGRAPRIKSWLGASYADRAKTLPEIKEMMDHAEVSEPSHRDSSEHKLD